MIVASLFSACCYCLRGVGSFGTLSLHVVNECFVLALTNSFSVILISVECRIRFSYESHAVVGEGDGKWAKIIHTHAKESARIVVIQCPQRISTKIRVQYVPEFGAAMIKR